MKAQTVSARLNPDTAKKLELLVKATARSKSYLVAEAIETYVEDQTWQIGAIKEGIEEADKGKFATDKEVHQLCHRRKSDGLLNGGVSPIVFIEWLIRGEFKT